MMFVDYHFHTAYDGSIILDQELSPEKINVQDGDTFVVRIVNGQVILQKHHGHSGTDQ